MNLMWVLRLFLFSTLHLGLVQSYRRFKELIPNGDSIPHSCKPNFIWHGVGHLHDEGGGQLNQFGKDFKRLGKKWTKSLCQLDSDGDGRLNGEELGDPDCVWSPGKVPTRRSSLTHPGVCDPFGDQRCAKTNAWVDCDIDRLQCNSTKEEGVKNLTLRMVETKVPDQETTYMCTVFDLPSDDDYHIIANEPFIDNKHVLHHMLLFGCPENEKINNMSANVPIQCGMDTFGCGHIIGMWGIGVPGECAADQYGFRMGLKGFKRALIQTHWNNPELKDNYMDSSGMTIYYTKKLREYDATALVVASYGFQLPPGQKEVQVVGRCARECSEKRFMKPIYIVSAWNHMHYLGRSQRITLMRNGKKIIDLTNEEHYNYDRPVSVPFQPPIEVKPGDELISTCTFKTTSRSNITYEGMGTFDEMCYGFLTFYPVKNVNSFYCGSFKSIPYCQLGEEVVDECSIQKFQNASYPEFSKMRLTVQEKCRTGSCSDSCKNHLGILQNHPCMKGDIGDFLKFYHKSQKNNEVGDFYNDLESCSIFNSASSFQKTCELANMRTIGFILLFYLSRAKFIC